jgi:acetyltransferase
VLAGRQLLLRPIQPQDLTEYHAMLQATPPDDRHMQFFRDAREPASRELAHFTQIDFERDMTFVAVDDAAAPGQQLLGVVQSHSDPDNVAAEFALLVRSEMQGQGLGAALLRKLVDYARNRGLQSVNGEIATDMPAWSTWRVSAASN